MQLKDKVIVVTGAAHGIGAALCRQFAAAVPRGIVLADLDEAPLAEVAGEVDGLAVVTDVSRRDEIDRLVEQSTARFGPIDLFCSNAGIEGGGADETDDAAWDRIWQVNVMAHRFAAEAVLPGMLERGNGYLLQTVSAAGLLSQVGGPSYSVTKHAALAYAEWLAISYHDRGIRVSCLCPQGVRTPMLARAVDRGVGQFLESTALDAQEVAEIVERGLADERFLILPHPQVAEYFLRKATDYDRWLHGMRRLQEHLQKQQS